MITKEQAKKVKEQLVQQIESTFPEDKKSSAKEQLESMNEEQLEEFLKQNKLMQTQNSKDQKCIFCSIVFGDIPSTKIKENEKSIAILEINPISKGHTIIIPKEHVPHSKEMPEEAHALAKELAEKLKTKLKPKEVKIYPANLFGHEIINLLPIYTDENENSPRKKATPEEIKQVQEKLTKAEEKIIIEEEPKKEIIDEKDMWLPKRIP